MFKVTGFMLMALLGSLSSCAQPVVHSIDSLRFLGSFEIPYNQPFKGTTIGGLSGIDYDSRNNQYFLISDDRSAIEPARFYTAAINVNAKGIDTVIFTGVHVMLRENGQPYPNAKQDRSNTPDPESIRYNELTGQLWWTSEGERTVNQKDTILQDPSLTMMDLSGKFAGTFPLPDNLTMRKTSQGPRQNGTLEGLTFADNYSTVYACIEEPLHEDGPRADLKPSNAWIRIYQFDTAGKKNVAQYAYALEPVAYPAILPSAFKVNGVPEILALDKHKLLVMERSFSTGRLPCTVKIFIADLSQATNVMSSPSLMKTPPAAPVTKKLLLNMDDLGIYIDNVEGVTLGPTLPNGHKTLLFVSDNNFNSFEKTQLLLFEINP